MDDPENLSYEHDVPTGNGGGNNVLRAMRGNFKAVRGRAREVWAEATGNRIGCGLALSLLLATALLFTGFGLLITLVVQSPDLFLEGLTGAGEDPTYDQPRLPAWQAPMAYQIMLNPHFELDGAEPSNKLGTVEGSVRLTLRLSKETALIVLNAGSNLKVLTGTAYFVANNTDQALNHKQIYHYPENEYVVIQFPQKLPISTLDVMVNYTGSLMSADMRALYTSTYLDPLQANKPVAILASQFESTDARSAFPCMDEPALKATFEVSVIVDRSGFEVLHNTPIKESSTTMDGRAYYKFELTPPMSTYLLALVVAPGYVKTSATYTPPFDALGPSIPVSVYTRPGQLAYAQFALNTTLRALTLFGNLLVKGYRLPKLDLVAIPDFAAGAMENWGLITFRETFLLVDHPTYPSVASQQRVAATIVHELAHQWFGNSVTMKWWSDLWLNEGVATAFEYWILSRDAMQFDQWNYLTNHIWLEQLQAMTYDALPSTHALVTNVTLPEEIGDLFDAISYSKGSSVLQMVADHINPSIRGAQSGIERLISALGEYETDFKESVADTEALWARLSRSLGFTSTDVKQNTANLVTLTKPWMQQPGFPLLIFDYRNDYQLNVRQERFLYDRAWATPAPSVAQAPASSNSSTTQAPVAPPPPPGSGWWVRLRLNGGNSLTLSRNKIDQNLVADQADTLLNVPFSSPAEAWSQKEVNGWFKANVDGRGYFRAAYPAATFNNIAKFMSQQLAANQSTTPFSEGDRANFINDALVLAGANYHTTLVTWSQAFELLRVLSLDPSYAVWRAALMELNNIADLLQDQPCYGNLGFFLFELVQPHIQNLGWGPVLTQDFAAMKQNPQETLLRGLLFDLAAEFDEQATLYPVAKQIFDSYMDDPNFILPGDIAPAVLKVVLRRGGLREWTQVLDKYTAAVNAEERIRLLRALGTTQKPYLLNQLLHLTLNASVIRPQDSAYAIEAVAANRLGGRVFAWYFVRSHWSTLSRAGFGVSSIIRSATERLSDTLEYTEVKQFFSASTASGYHRTITLVTERIERNRNWLTANGDAVCNWLSVNAPARK